MFVDSWIATVIGIVLFTLLAPILGCLLAGIDRKLTARMQGRVGPSILQPYYDVRKLLGKEKVSVSGADDVYITAALLCVLVAGGIFYSGGNFLMVVFIVTLGALFFILAAYSTRSPYAELGAHREVMQVVSYEPMVLLVAVGLYQTTGSFSSSAVLEQEIPIVVPAILFFVGFLFILTIKMRKSPFDLSYSHHAHQDLVKGISTEMSGPMLARVEIMHWCENVLFLGWVGMFFLTVNPISWVAAIVVALVAFVFEIWIDNNFARVKWQAMLGSAWLVALVAGGVNMIALML